MVNVAVADRDASECGVPAVAARGLHLVEGAAVDFAQIDQSLVNADERRCHAEIHLLASSRLETYQCQCMIRLDFILSSNFISVNDLHHLKRRIGNDYEPVSEIVRHSSVVIGDISHDLVILRYDLHE